MVRSTLFSTALGRCLASRPSICPALDAASRELVAAGARCPLVARRASAARQAREASPREGSRRAAEARPAPAQATPAPAQATPAPAEAVRHLPRTKGVVDVASPQAVTQRSR